jgi:hypothetical protein
VQIKSEWTRHELGATLRGSYYAYASQSEVNRPTADTKVFGRYDATRDLRFEGEGRFLLGTDNPGSPNLQAGLAKIQAVRRDRCRQANPRQPVVEPRLRRAYA